MSIPECGEGRSGANSVSGTSSCNRIKSSPSNNRTCFILIECCFLLSMFSSITNARTVKPTTALANEDLIEGKLENSNQLCGIRYANSFLHQRKQSSNKNNNNYYSLYNGDNLLYKFLGSKNEEEPRAGEENAEAREAGMEDEAPLYYIVGGDEVEDDQFWPWSVAIYELDPLNGQKEFICSGSLISDRFVLTAAHCIQQSRFDILTADEIFLKIAAVRLDDERVPFYHIEKVFVHPEYIANRKANDIALLKLNLNKRNLPPRARPICLPSNVANRIDFTDQQVTIIGWGKTSAMKGDEPTRLIDAVTTPTTTSGQETNELVNDEMSDPSGGFEVRDQSFNYYETKRRRLNAAIDQKTEINKNKTNPSPISEGAATGALFRANGKEEQNNDNNYNSNSNSNSNQEAEISGSSGSSSTQTNDTLLQAEVRVTSTDQCNRNYSKLEISWLNIDEHFLCASDPQGKRDACQGDSGGPLMWNTNNQQQQQQQQQLHLQIQPANFLSMRSSQTKSFSSSGAASASSNHLDDYQQQEKWYQLGLVSFGHGCANSQFPGVYTRISYYMPWILNIVNGRHKNENNHKTTL